jgi:MoaA/NifB/PqqE/SkfB family radical SAM enzyme
MIVKKSEIQEIEMDLTGVCNLSCPLCSRNYQHANHMVEKNVRSIDTIIKQLDQYTGLKRFFVAGTVSEHTMYKDFIIFIEYLNSRDSYYEIFTNGNTRKQEWWEKLVTRLTSRDTVVFSVDGTPKNFTQYRVNADWESILTGMKVVANAECHSKWKYIPFAFNQLDIEEVQQLSDSIGIKEFYVEFSDRFDERTEFLKPDTTLVGPRYVAQTQWKVSNTNLTISPKCNRGQDHFITADGYYTPCCYLADHRFYYKTPFGKNKKQYDIRNHTFTTIMEQPQTIDFYQNLDQQPGCQFNCPG